MRTTVHFYQIKNRQGQYSYLHPENDLHMTEIKARPEVLARCGRDVVTLFDQKAVDEDDSVVSDLFHNFPNVLGRTSAEHV